MFKINQKISFYKKSENSPSYRLAGDGIVKGILYGKGSEPSFLEILWIDFIKDGVFHVTELVPVKGPRCFVKSF